MADSIIQLPYTATTSGDILDAATVTVGAQTVKRERMVLGNDASSAVAVVTTAGALTVTQSTAISLSSAPTVNISSGIVTLSSNPTVTIGASLVNLAVAPVDAITAVFQPITSSGGGLVTVSSESYLVRSLSSGTVTLSSNPTVVSASSGFVQVYQSTSPWAITGTVLSASSGLVQVLQSTGVWAVSLSSGTVTLSSAIGISSGMVTLVASSGGVIPATSSGGLFVHLTNGSAGGGSTAVSLEGAAGVIAPVTSSYGLSVTQRSTGILFGVMTATVGAPLTTQLTSAALWLYSVTFATTAGTAGNAFALHSATSALSSNTGQIRLTNPTAVSMVQVNYPRGVFFANGIQLTDSVTFGTTGTNTAGVTMTIEYEV